MLQLPPIHPIEEVAWRSDYILAPQDRTELEDIYAKCILCVDEAQTSDLETRISRLQSALASYKNFPSEILSFIFSLSRPDSGYWIPRGVSDGRSYPEHVCSLWRHIALSTPSLYRAVYIDYSDFEAGALYRHSALIEMTSFSREIIARGARELLIEFYRLESTASQDALRRLLAPGPQLEKLKLRHSNASPDFVNLTLSLLPSMPPSLRYLAIDFCNAYDIRRISGLFTSSHLTSDIPWKTLQYLSLCGMQGDLALSPGTVHLLLSKCPHLQTCKLRLSGSVPSPNPSLGLTTQAIYLERLIHLDLLLLASSGEWPHPDRFGSLLSSLTLPSLEEMSIKGSTDALVKVTDLCNLFDRSRCQLKWFQFFISSFSEQDLHRLLLSKSLSTLKKLYLTTSPIYASVLREIASGELLPRLIHLKGTIRADAESVDALYYAARSRKGVQEKGVTELKMVDFFCGINNNIPPDPPLPPTPSDLVKMYRLAGGSFGLEFLAPPSRINS